MSAKKERGPGIKLHAPGRINLIGEHTDYNLGLVLPAAIQHGISIELTPRSGNQKCSVQSTDQGSSFSFDLDALPGNGKGWENYVLGVIHEILRRCTGLRGFDCRIASDLPTGAGLSSSAALTCGLAAGLNALFNLKLDTWDIMDIAREAEHRFAGTRCGLMDPFASVMGRADHFVFLDCQSLEFEYIPAYFDAYEWVLFWSGVTHRLSESSYNQRRKTCEEAVATLGQRYKGIKSLRDISLEQLLDAKDVLPPDSLQQCRFVLEENERVVQTVEALKQCDLHSVGQRLFESHNGLRDHYKVSCPELDFLVARGLEHPDVLGARIMGGGFGGCSLNLIRSGKSETVFESIAAGYKETFDLDLDMIPVQLSEGVRILP